MGFQVSSLGKFILLASIGDADMAVAQDVVTVEGADITIVQAVTADMYAVYDVIALQDVDLTIV